jgi:hypothetical protein
MKKTIILTSLGSLTIAVSALGHAPDDKYERECDSFMPDHSKPLVNYVAEAIVEGDWYFIDFFCDPEAKLEIRSILNCHPKLVIEADPGLATEVKARGVFYSGQVGVLVNDEYHEKLTIEWKNPDGWINVSDITISPINE